MDKLSLTLRYRSKKIWFISFLIITLLASFYIYISDKSNSYNFYGIIPKTFQRAEKLNLYSEFNSTHQISTKTKSTTKIPVQFPHLFSGKRISRFYEGASVPLAYFRDPAAFQKYKNYLAAKESPLPLQKKAVIILTNHRSGSSFFGELFNQHPDVFYSFEPLIGTTGGSLCKNTEERLSIVRDMSQCIVPDWMNIYTKIGVSRKEIWKIKNLSICSIQKFCFSAFTKELCEERHCPKTRFHKPGTPGDCNKQCGKRNVNLIENDCRRKKMVAMKLIRLCDINKLKFLVTELNLDLKILHLVRDPRGIAYSRHMLKKGTNLTESLHFTCEKQLNNTRSAFEHQPQWLQGRYKFVRYEDTALFPYQTAQEVYDFVGLNMTENIYEWIRTNTGQKPPPPVGLNGDQVSESKEMTENIISNIRKQMRNPWGHTRVSSTVVQKWKYHLPYGAVEGIESVCKDIMKFSGYQLTTDHIQYTYNKTIDYIKQFRPPPV